MAEQVDADVEASLQQYCTLSQALEQRLQVRLQLQQLQQHEQQTTRQREPLTEEDLHVPRPLLQRYQPSNHSRKAISPGLPCTDSQASGYATHQSETATACGDAEVATAEHSSATLHGADGSKTSWSVESGNRTLQWDPSLLALAGEQSLCSTDTQACPPANTAYVSNTAPASRRAPAPAPWKQQLQQELQQEQLLQQQAAREAAAAAKQRAAIQKAEAWRAAQQHLPFTAAPSKVAGTQHRLHKTLSNMLRYAGPAAAAAAATAAAKPAAELAPAASPAAAASASVAAESGQAGESGVPLAAAAGSAGVERRKAVRLSLMEMHLKQLQQQAATVEASINVINSSSTGAITRNPDVVSRRSSRSPSSSTAGQLPVSNVQSAPSLGVLVPAVRCPSPASPADSAAASPRSSSSRPRSRTATSGAGLPAAAASMRASSSSSPRSTAAAWAAADSATDAEVDAFLQGHWQQQHLPAAALVLQCAWRSRGPRLAFNRYIGVRQQHVAASLGPAFSNWWHWTLARHHHRRAVQRQAFQAWRELVQLQLVLCNKLVRALQRGVLAGDTTGLLMWRLCTPVDEHHRTAVRPSMGRLLASILQRKEPERRLQSAFSAWLEHCRTLQGVRAKVHTRLSAAGLRWRKATFAECLRFWRMHAVANCCERLGIALPLFKPRSVHFETWLWQHERRRQLEQRAEALFQRICLRRCFGGWRSHGFKVRAMKAAWSGLVLHSSAELLRGGMSAFKTNWREQQLQRALLAGCLGCWQGLAHKYRAAAVMRQCMQEAANCRAKAGAMLAFKRCCRMSQLLSAAGTLRLWQARPLALAHVLAWMGDVTHMTLYLCWWRWRRRAVARLRLRAALGLHMYRAHWLDLELAFSGWRKVAAVNRPSRLSQQQQDAQFLQRRNTGAAACVVVCDADADGNASVESVSAVASDKLFTATEGAATGTHQALHLAAGTAEAVAAAAAVSCQPLDRSQQLQVGQQDPQQDPQQQQDVDNAEEQQQEPVVHVSLADYPVGMPWRPLEVRAGVMAQRGLQRLSGARLAKAVRDLRELEGPYIVKEHKSGAEGLLGSVLFRRHQVSPGLKAMVTAQLPMNVLWRFTCQGDSTWWQRVVGLVRQHVPHPDSWRSLISSCSSTCNSTTHSSSCSGSGAAHAQERNQVHAFLHGNATRVRTSPSVATKQVPGGGYQAAGHIATRAAAARLSGFVVKPLQLEGDAADSAHVHVSWQRSSPTAPQPQQLAPDSAFVAAAAACCVEDAILCLSNAGGGLAASAAAAAAAAASWPSHWSPEDVAWLSQLVQAEELLETAVHMLLGVGADSSGELYDKLRAMARGQGLALQGDLLAWLLSSAIAHDTAQANAAMLRARARDEMLQVTMQMRERAMAVHLHFPLKFTLSRSTGPAVDGRAAWTAIIKGVEAERDWDASSADEDEDDPRSSAWASLMQQGSASQSGTAAQGWDGGQQDEQQQQHYDTEWQGDGSAVGQSTQQTHVQKSRQFSTDAELLPGNADEASAAAAVETAGAAACAGAEPSSLSLVSAVSASTAAAVAIAAAAAVAGPEFGSPELSPGSMLGQVLASGELQLYHASCASTPSGDKQQQADLQLQQLNRAAEEKRARHQQRAEQKQQRHQQAAMAAAAALFRPAATSMAASDGGDATSTSVKDMFSAEEVFGGPPAYSIGTVLNSARSARATGEFQTPRMSGGGRGAGTALAAASSTGSGSAHAASAAGGRPKLGAAATLPALVSTAEQQRIKQQQQQQPAAHGGWRAFQFNASLPGGSSSCCSSKQAAGRSSGAAADPVSAAAGRAHRGSSSSSSRPASSTGSSASSSNSRATSASRLASAPSTGQHGDSSTGTAAAAVPASTAAYAGSDSSSQQEVLLEELNGILVGVLGPASDADSAAAQQALEAAAGLADACAGWLQEQGQQQPDEEGPGDEAEDDQHSHWLQQQQQQQGVLVDQPGRAAAAVSSSAASAGPVQPGSQQCQAEQLQQPAGRLSFDVAAGSPSPRARVTAVIKDGDGYQVSPSSNQPVSSRRSNSGLPATPVSRRASSAADRHSSSSNSSVAAARGVGRATRAVPTLALGGPFLADSSGMLASSSGLPGSGDGAAVAARGDSSARPSSGLTAQRAADASCSLPGSAYRVSGGAEPGSAGASRGSSRAAALMQLEQATAAAAAAAADLTAWSMGRDSDGFSGGPNDGVSDEVWAKTGLGAEDNIGQQQQQWLQQVDANSGNQIMHKVPSRRRQQAGTGCGDVADRVDPPPPPQRQQQQGLQLSACSSSSSLPSIPSSADVLHAMQQSQRQKRQQGCQLPALRNTHTGSSISQPQQQSTAASLPQVQQGQEAAAAAADAADNAGTAVLEAVWKAAPAAAKPAARPTVAGHDAPSLHSLVQQAAKHEWEHFELLARELAAQLAAALWAPHASASVTPTTAQYKAMAEPLLAQAVPEQPQAAVAEQQMQQQQLVQWLGSAGVVPNTVAATAALGGGGGGGGGGPGLYAGAELTGVLSRLMKAPLAARFVFWRQMVGGQQWQTQQPPWHGCMDSSSSRVAAQLHELAWGSLLQQQPAAKRRAMCDQAGASSSLAVRVAGAAAASPRSLRLQEKLQQYMQAHVQWRERQQGAEPLLPAEKWPTLEHEEQVLDFITSLTISVYHSLLRKHRGLPPAEPKSSTASATANQAMKHVTAFGSSSTRSMSSSTAAAGAAKSAAVVAAAVAGVRAKGQALPALPKKAPTKPREAKCPAAHIFVIPAAPYGDAASAANVASRAAGSAPSSSVQRQQQRSVLASGQLQHAGACRAELVAADAGRLEAWQGWRTAAGTPVNGSRQAQQDSRADGRSNGIEFDSGVNAAANAAAAAAAAEGGIQDGLVTARTSCCSDASSWQLQDT